MQRGRKGSKPNIAPLHANAMSPRLTAPASLTKEEKLLFDKIVAAVPPKHFVTHQAMLLASYAKTCVRLQHINASDADFVDLTRLQFSIATRLRLTPQSLVHKETAARRAAEHEPSLIEQFLRDHPSPDDEDAIRRRSNGRN